MPLFTRSKLLRSGVLFACAAGLAGCGGTTPAPPTKQYPIHAVVLSVDSADHTVKLKHNEIKGFMEAMTMDYNIKDRKDLEKLRAGETIDGTLFVQDTDFWVGNVKEVK